MNRFTRCAILLRKACSIFVLVGLTACAAPFQLQAAPSYMSLGVGDFPRYVTKIVVDNNVMDEAGKSISWGAWTVSFVGKDPAVAKWGTYVNPTINVQGFSIRHLKCHNDVMGDIIDGENGICAIYIDSNRNYFSIGISGKGTYLNQRIDFPYITFQ